MVDPHQKLRRCAQLMQPQGSNRFMRKLLLGTNLKMYKTATQTLQYLSDLSSRIIDLRDKVDFFVIPSFTSLPVAVKFTDYVKIGAQNMHWEEQGQFTGEISPLMLKDLGDISIIEIGHSERRHVFNESSKECNHKLTTAVKHGFTALLCVGETTEEKEFGIADEVLRSQLKIGLFDIDISYIKQLWIAYEPVWSIGVDGTPASTEYAQEKYTVIRNLLIDLYGDAGLDIPILYGGSVNNGNAAVLIGETDVDGLFIGRSAWDAENFDRVSRLALGAWEAKLQRQS